jgi:predicted lipid-binding transport protein (Tim44 family)
MSDENLIKSTPQFKTAEYADKPGIDRCQSCGQLLPGDYFRVNGALACSACAEKAKLQVPQDSRQNFMRGLMFGAGGALLGLILYSTFAIVTGWVIGYVSLAVGYIVGKAMLKGSRGIGGRRYQIAAAALTYAAVSVSAIPIGIAQYIKASKTAEAVTQSANSTNNAAPSGQAAQPAADRDSDSEDAGKAATGLVGALGMLLLTGLASPFLELENPTSGLIGLVILFVGINIAWKLTGTTPVDILGPFSNSGAQSEPSITG